MVFLRCTEYIAFEYTIAYNVIMKFDWDDTKNRINQKKHGVWFEETQTVWADEYSVEFFDPKHSEGEDRFIRIGLSPRSNLLIVVFCERDHGFGS